MSAEQKEASKHKWGEFYDDRTRDTWARFIGGVAHNASIIEHVVSLNPRRLLEVGCGPASLSIFLSYLGYAVTGLDRDEKVLATAAERNRVFRGRVTLLAGDAFNLPFEDDAFDVVYNQGFFEHFSDEDIRRLVGECLRVARALVFKVPNANYPRQDFGDERLLTREQWERILSPFELAASFCEGREASWESPFRRLREMLASLVLRKDIRKPRHYVAVVRRPA
jgi:SAM-dependent methyltransferase